MYANHKRDENNFDKKKLEYRKNLNTENNKSDHA